MCLMVWKRTFYGKVNLSTTCQCRQLKVNPLSTQINIYCLMTNQTPLLLVQRAPWTRAAVCYYSPSNVFAPPPFPQQSYNPRRLPPRYIWKSRYPRRYNLRSGSIFVSLWKLHSGGKAKRKESLIQTFYETSPAHFFGWLTFAESANQNYFRCLFF